MAIYIVVQDFLLEMFVTDQNPDRQIDQQTNIATLIAKLKICRIISNKCFRKCDKKHETDLLVKVPKR